MKTPTPPTVGQPSFLIIGAQKCGTTWLHHQLAEHPDIYLNDAKDDEFFSYTSPKPLAEYTSKFSAAADQHRIGDSCASYFWSPRDGDTQPQGFNREIPHTILAALGADCRFIVLLKDPVQRTLSAYLHHLAHGTVSCDIPISAAPDHLGLIAISRYGHHLHHWLESLSHQQRSHEQLLILPDPGSANAEDLLRRCCRFLGIDANFHFPRAQKKIFTGLKRIQNDDGLWVALGQRGLDSVQSIQRPAPLVTHQGDTYIRLVHPAEINWIRDQLRQDTAHFAAQLSDLKLDSSDFRHWQDWPTT